MLKVLMMGSSSSVKGGITSVISQILNHDWKEENICFDFIPTYIEASPLLMVSFYLKAVISLLFKLIFSKPDVVYIHMSYKGSFTRKYIIHRICKFFKTKDVIHLHGSEFEKWYNQCDRQKQNKIRRLLLECDKLIVLGEEWNRKVLQIEEETKTEIVKNSVTIPDIKVRWNNERCQVLFLGVLIPRKGVADLFHAISILKKRNNLSILNFVIAGSGPEQGALESLAKQLQIEDVVEFAGWTDGDKKARLLAESQVMVLPSYNEGLPVSILEAISHGMPIISTHVGDIPSAVNDKENGFLVSPGDVENLSLALRNVCNESVFNEMSAISRRLAEEKFSDEKFFLQLRKIFYEICK